MTALLGLAVGGVLLIYGLTRRALWPFVFVVLGGPSVIWLVAIVRKRHHLRRSLCKECGYDLDLAVAVTRVSSRTAPESSPVPFGVRP